MVDFYYRVGAGRYALLFPCLSIGDIWIKEAAGLRGMTSHGQRLSKQMCQLVELYNDIVTYTCYDLACTSEYTSLSLSYVCGHARY